MYKPLLILAVGMNFFNVSPSEAVDPVVLRFLRDGSHQISMDGMLPVDPALVPVLTSLVINHADTLSNFVQIAPTTREQKIVVVCEEWLRPKDYTAFISGLCDLKTSNKVTLDTLKAVTRARLFKTGFLAYNYDQPAVAAVIDKLATIFQQDEPNVWTDYFTKLRSGQGKQDMINEANRLGSDPPESYNDATCEEYDKLLSTPSPSPSPSPSP